MKSTTISLVSMLLFAGCKKETPAPVPEPAQPVLPTVSTMAVTNITFQSAKGGGNVTSEGNSALTSVGLCWDTLSMPTTLRNKHTAGVGTGGFVGTMDKLMPGKKYFVRAYASNLGGTAYGNEVEFTTPVSTQIDFLCEKNFKLISLTTVPSQFGLTELYPTVVECDKDDILRFEKDGTIIFDEGATKCNSTDPQIEKFTWQLSNDNKKITIDNTSTWDVLKNDGVLLIYTQSVTTGSGTFIYTYTYKAI